MSGQTERSRRAHRSPRPPLDRTSKRYFVYHVRDADGVVIYVGRSCNVAQRLRAHISMASHPDPNQNWSRTWIGDARSVSLAGPYTWDEACRAERAAIELAQPRGNRQHTRAHGWNGGIRTGKAVSA